MQSVQRPQTHEGRKVLVNVRGMMRSPRAAERCDSQRITVRYKSEHLREVWRGFTAQAAENKQTKFERDSLPDREASVTCFECHRRCDRISSSVEPVGPPLAAPTGADRFSWSLTPASRLLQ